MEFFRDLSNVNVESADLKTLVTIKNLPELCDSIDTVIHDNGNDGAIYCLWGEFKVNREELKHGIRFSMPGCPNALAWTVTADQDENSVVIHCTINKRSHDPDFIESIEFFADDWAEGLNKALSLAHKQ